MKKQSAFSLQQSAIAALLLLIFFTFSLSQLVSTSPTFDEGFYILRGYAFWRTGHLIPLGHPPLAQHLSALGVSLEPNLPDPTTLNGWATDKYDDAAYDLLWQRELNTNRIVFLARFPILLIGLLMGAITFKWAKELFGWQSGLAALALHALSPNLLAHTAIATTDLPVAAFYFFTLYFFYRFTQKQTRVNAILVSISLGLALAAKFSALLLLPTLGLLAIIHLIRKPTTNYKLLFTYYFSLFLITCLTVAATYFFSPALAQYFTELTHLNQLAAGGHNAFLFGQISDQGWWYYHLVVLAVKTPLPALLLFIIGLIVISRQPSAISLLVPIFIYFLAASLTSLNVGYRYLLPIIPLIHIIASSAVSRWLLVAGKKQFIIRLSSFAFFIFHFASTLLAAPNFIAYFNELAFGQGYKILSDSNIDWGQDLPALSKYLNGRKVYLSYFGQADPTYYGINATLLTGWPPPRVEPTFYSPADPAPGLYAISASNLVGVQLYDANAFAYFRDLKPTAIINQSIFIYEVPTRQPVTAIAQCTPPLLNQATTLINKQVRQIIFDCATSLIIPAQPSLLLFPLEKSPLVSVGNPVYQWRWANGVTRYQLYRVIPTESSSIITKGKYLSLIKFALTSESLNLYWRVDEPAPPPVSIFVHFNYPDGALADAADGLGVSAEQWQRGDVIVTQHLIPKDLPNGTYEIKVGLYSLMNGERFSEINLAQLKK